MRISVWILGDHCWHGTQHSTAAEIQVHGNVVVVLVESAARLGRVPYQRKKRVLLLSAMRHYAAVLAAEGYAVDYIRAPALSTDCANAWPAGSPIVCSPWPRRNTGRQLQQGRWRSTARGAGRGPAQHPVSHRPV